MVAVLPERSLPVFALIVFLGGAAGNQLHTVGDDVRPGVFDQKMNMVRGDHIVEHGQTEAFFCLENPVQIAATVARSERSGILSSPSSTA